jgi:hypothetical protein
VRQPSPASPALVERPLDHLIHPSFPIIFIRSIAVNLDGHRTESNQRIDANNTINSGYGLAVDQQKGQLMAVREQVGFDDPRHRYHPLHEKIEKEVIAFEHSGLKLHHSREDTVNALTMAAVKAQFSQEPNRIEIAPGKNGSLFVAQPPHGGMISDPATRIAVVHTHDKQIAPTAAEMYQANIPSAKDRGPDLDLPNRGAPSLTVGSSTRA